MRTSALPLSLVRSLSLAPLAVASWSGSPDPNCNYPLPHQEQRRPQPQPQHQRYHQYQQQGYQQGYQSQGPTQQQGHQQEFYHDPGPYHYTKVAQMENMSPSISQGVAVNGPQDLKKVPIEELIPQRFVIGCQGDMAEASRRWRATCKWRKENGVDGVIERPQPWFHGCREVFPVYVHGRSRKGLPVLWEQIGKVNLPRAEELGLPLSEILPNYIFLNECIWRVILDKGENDNDDAKFITVEDVAGVRLWHLTPRILSIVRSLTGTMKEHYVERCYKSYIINAPRAFMALWRIISPMLDPRTRAKITIVGTNYADALAEEIDPSELPAEYGGTSGRPIYDSDDERKIQALVARLNANDKGVVSRCAATGSSGYKVHCRHGAPPRPLA